MIVHDFRCDEGHVSEHYVSRGVTHVSCPICSKPSRLVFLTAPKLDWSGMAQGESAGPEFIDRFEKAHRKETERQEKILREHGDYGPGYDAPPTVQDA